MKTPFFTFSTFALPPLGVLELGQVLGQGTVAAMDLSVGTDLTAPKVAVEWARVAGRKGAIYLKIPSNEISSTVKLPRAPAVPDSNIITIDQIRNAFHGDEDYSLFALDPTTQEQVNQSDNYWFQRLNDSACWTHAGLKNFDTGDGNFHNISQYGFYELVALAQQIHHAPIAFTAIPHDRQQVTVTSSSSFFRKHVTTTVSYYLHPTWVISTPAVTGQHQGVLINPMQYPNTFYSFINVNSNGVMPMEEMTSPIYSWSQTQSGWTGFAVFAACVVLGALAVATGGAALIALGAVSNVTLAVVGIGAAAGAIGGLVATGGNPTTNVMASFTPFSDQESPGPAAGTTSTPYSPVITGSTYPYHSPAVQGTQSLGGDAAQVVANTDREWLNPDIFDTPSAGGGVELFASKIDYRAALACGGANNVACGRVMTTLPVSDPRFQEVFGTMFSFPQKTLEQENYPFTSK